MFVLTGTKIVKIISSKLNKGMPERNAMAKQRISYVALDKMENS